jgi:hypothetical protein
MPVSLPLQWNIFRAKTKGLLSGGIFANGLPETNHLRAGIAIALS